MFGFFNVYLFHLFDISLHNGRELRQRRQQTGNEAMPEVREATGSGAAEKQVWEGIDLPPDWGGVLVLFS